MATQLPPRGPARRAPQGERPPRAMLYARRYLALDEYRRELALGSHKQLSNLDKMKRFGSTIVPIHVPLAPGETKEQYEARFRGWLALQGLSLEELEKDANENLERYFWFNFAHENARGAVKFTPAPSKSHESESQAREEGAPDRKRPRSETTAPGGESDEANKKKRMEEALVDSSSTARSGTQYKASRSKDIDKTIDRSASSSTSGSMVSKTEPASEPLKFKCVVPPRNASLKEVAAAYSSCGCRRCLTRGMQHLAMAVTKIEARKCTTCADSKSHTSVVDLTAVNERDDSKERRGSSPPRKAGDLPCSKDTVELQLLTAYDEVNEQIVMNENALQTEVTRLAANPLSDIQEMARLHDENQELREMLQSEMAARNAALAMLIVYMWREEISDLESMVNDPTAQNVAPIQRTSHSRCAQIATAVAEKNEYVEKLKRQLESMNSSHPGDARRLASMKLRVEEMLHKAETAIQTLFDQRRQQLRVLVQFDAALRQCIQLLLKKATRIHHREARSA